VSETITACENICRDFFWLRDAWPWLGPSLIASATALLIAFRAYAWQKSKDRAVELRREQRQAYREFIEDWLIVEQQIGASRKVADKDMRQAMKCYGDGLRMADACVYKLGLSGSETVLTCAAQMHTSLYETYREFGENVKSIYTESPNGEVSKLDIAQSFADANSKLRDSLREQLEELLFLMRSEEFSAAGRLEIMKPTLIDVSELED